MKRKGTSRRGARARNAELDRAIVGLLIGAMEANDRMTPDEAERAHHLVWSTSRFRRRSGESVGRLIDQMRTAVATEDPAAFIARSASAVPAKYRAPVFALVADLLLADGRIDRKERDFLTKLAGSLRLRPSVATAIVDVIRTKNSL